MGVSGSGKSEIGRRIAELLGCRHLEGDAYHSQKNVDKMSAGIPLTDEDRRDWLMQIRDEIAAAVDRSESLVISCSALKRGYRDILRSGDPDLQFVHLQGDRSLITQRMKARSNHFMPTSLVDSQFRDLEPLGDDEAGICLDIRLEPDELVRRFRDAYLA